MKSKFTNFRHLSLLCFSLLLPSVTNALPFKQSQFPNALELRSSLTQTNVSNTSAALFSDMGAWQAYSLPTRVEEYGGFNGPALFNKRGVVLSESVAKLSFTVNSKPFLFENAKATYYPGKAVMEYNSDNVNLKQSLIFTDHRTALVQTLITNNSDVPITVKWGWAGIMKAKTTLSSSANQIRININNGIYIIDFNDPMPYNIELSDNSYTANSSREYSIQAHKNIVFDTQHSNFIDAKDEQANYKKLSSIGNYFLINESRWDFMLTKALQNFGKLGQDKMSQNLKVKAVITLLTNWRSAAGDLKHDGIFPSFSTFDGFWAWDSWKHAAACARFFPELGKNNIRAMFDYQDEAGMVADCVYITAANNNYRDSKPPLAAWAVWAIYKQTADKEFVKEMYPKLLKYHQWWYANRDHDHNGLCEFGSTDGTREAAAWESGMDNAVRYDNAKMLKNNDKAWSLDQESVDLNSFLYAEKLILAQMCDVLKIKGAYNFKADAAKLKKEINQLMFDKTMGYYYDVKIADKSKLLMEGTEGWHPLWANLATKSQAVAVAKIMADTTRFNTFVPFPTYAANRKEFDPENGYWRGPVWLDQVLFGVEGLRNYGLDAQADAMLHKFLNNAEGMKDNQPINENYNPLTGKRLGANHFSWSAAALLMLLSE